MLHRPARRRLLAGLAAGLLVPGLAACAGRPAQPEVRGTVAWTTGESLQAGDEVRLAIVGLAPDGQEQVLATDQLEPGEVGPPLRFAIPYEPGAVVAGRAYELRGTVLREGRPVFETTEAPRVLGAGAAGEVALILVPALE